MWYEKKDKDVIFSLKVQPKSSKNSFEGILGDSLKVKIKAPPVDGEANREIVNFFAKSFKVAKSDVELLGLTSKNKKIKIPLSQKVEEFIKNYER